MLSGGVDSTGLACLTRDLATVGQIALPHGLRTFTATAPGSSLDEAETAQLVASHVQAGAHATAPSSTTLVTEDLHSLVRTQDEPFGSLSIYMQYCVMRLAHSTGTTVTLSGQGADELFLGYPWHHYSVLSDLLREGQVKDALRSVSQSAQSGGLGMPRALAYAVAGSLPAARKLRQLSRLAGHLRINPFDRTVNDALKRVTDRTTGRDTLECEISNVGLPGLLRYEDRNSMAFSIESRLPYLDFRLLNLAFSLPSWTKIRGGWSKFLLRKAIEPYAPKPIVWSSRKIGFAAPEGAFLSALAPLALDLFTESARSSAFLRSNSIRTLAQSNGAPPPHLWRFLNLELWMRLFRVSAG
jgi:asparagine synthase (glutamine-hydrolysing)